MLILCRIFFTCSPVLVINTRLANEVHRGGGTWRQIIVEDGLCTMAKEQVARFWKMRDRSGAFA